jgi:hypothetical protein
MSLMMMTDPITPPPELIEEWWGDVPRGTSLIRLATQAAQWGADQELRACCDTLQRHAHWDLAVFELMDDRRPKPSSLKERALHELTDVYNRDKIDDSTYDTIRRALEALND